MTTDTLAAALERARLERRALAPPEVLASLDLPGAYAIQDEVIALRAQAGLHPAGWKLGNTSAVKQRVMGLPHPVFGRIFEAGRIANGGTVVTASLIAPRFEPELAFGLHGPLVAGVPRSRLVESIAWVAPALEVTDSHYTAGKRTAVELIADCTSAYGFVIGAPIEIGRAGPLDELVTELLRNGESIARGSTRDVLGDPLIALELLAAHLHERGRSTGAGEVVMSGAITDAFSAVPGDHVEARIAGIGAVAVRFA
jgi:2-oxo-3-hexenedioate decarboxylase